MKMKKSSILTISLLLAVALLTAGVMGCSNTSPADSPSPSPSPSIPANPETPATVPAKTPEVNVSLNTQAEGIWVSGSGKVAVTPDIALLQLGIETQEATVAEAQAKASEAMDKVKASLTDSGVAEKDIQTRSFRISQRTRWDDVQQQEVVTGYRVTNQVVAKIRDMEKVSSIIDAVVAAGGDYTRISSLNFSVDDPTAYYDEAREKAMADAERKAEQIAGLAGMKLGMPTYINESATTPVSSYSVMSYEMQIPAPMPAPAIVIPETSVSPGEIEISINMQVAYSVAGKAD
ncbi:MAG: SIMPL domain-containing protein [Dehalococcoidales bacterium]|nr:SIMPL domain-containing protein [Dehalococcoidales bacterium]